MSTGKRNFELDGFHDRLKQIVDEDFGGIQDKFSKAVGLHNPTVDGWTNNNVYPKINYLAQICTTLGISIEWLTFGTGSRRATNHGADEGAGIINQSEREDMEKDEIIMMYREKVAGLEAKIETIYEMLNMGFAPPFTRRAQNGD